MATTGAATVLHADMDAFFAAVEVRRRPELVGRPVIVGGTGNRGVVAAASYEARSFGVHSAMPTARARRLCPDGVFLAGDHAHYREVSERVMAVFGSFTPLVEAVSLDEAFLEVSGARRLFGSPVAIAGRIREAVRATEGLECSVGVAPNKLLAKLASQQAKPRAGRAGASGISGGLGDSGRAGGSGGRGGARGRTGSSVDRGAGSSGGHGPQPGRGVVVVEPADALDFLHPLPVRKLWGVGPATQRSLAELGIRLVGELAATPAATLVSIFGEAQGRRLAELARGYDPDPVVAHTAPKSMSSEVTFAHDIAERAELRAEIVRQADTVAARLRAGGYVARTVVLKLRYGDFRLLTRARQLPHATAHAPRLADAAKQLLASLEVSAGVRLLGLGAAGLSRDVGVQLTLAEARRAPEAALDEALDELRARFGTAAIGPAGARTAGHAAPTETRPWGPDAPT